MHTVVRNFGKLISVVSCEIQVARIVGPEARDSVFDDSADRVNSRQPKQ